MGWAIVKDLIYVDTWLDFRCEGGEVEKKGVPIVNILSLVQYLFDDHGLDIPPHALKSFWEHARAHLPWAANHPAAQDADRIPLGIYGDEARYSSESGQLEKLIVITLNCTLWSPKSSRNSRFIICVLRETLPMGSKTLWPLYQYIAWAFNILYHGRKPSRGYRGMPLASNLQSVGNSDYLCQGKHKFFLSEVRGDWSWHMSSLGLSARWNSKSLCFKCNAKRHLTGGPLGDSSYLDFSPTASWIQHQTTHVEFLNSKLLPGCICHTLSVYLFLSYKLLICTCTM